MRIKNFFKSLISDIKEKRLTHRVELFFGCIAALILTAIIVIAVIGSSPKKTIAELDKPESVTEGNGELSENEADRDSESGIEVNELDKNYDKDADVIDEEKYKDTVLSESDDAGEEYINETLFIGDSNTVRMMNLGYTTIDNTIAVVGMGIQSVKTLKCVEFSGYSSGVTMVEAVKLMQPRRIIITFGTNNATGMDTDTFIKKYNEALDAISGAYPYADILINSVPPFAKKNSYPKLSITSVDKFNVALNEMAKERGLKFINSSSVLKDESTGYARPEYMAGDGIHITKEGFDAMFKYIRTHSHIVEDTRPKPLSAVPKQIKATYVIGGDGKMRNDKASYEEMSVDPNIPVTSYSNTDIPVQTATSSSEKPPHSHSYSLISEKKPTYDEDGYKEYKCDGCGNAYRDKLDRLERPEPEVKPKPPLQPDTTPVTSSSVTEQPEQDNNDNQDNSSTSEIEQTSSSPENVQPQEDESESTFESEQETESNSESTSEQNSAPSTDTDAPGGELD